MRVTLFDVFKLAFISTLGIKIADLTWDKFVKPKLK